MFKTFSSLGLFLTIFPAYGSQYFLNGHPISNYIDLNSQNRYHHIKSYSANDANNVAIITMEAKRIEVRWGKLEKDYNALGQNKQVSGKGIIAYSLIDCPSIQDRRGLIGLTNSPLELHVNKASFEQTSLTFGKHALILPPQLGNEAFRGLYLTKRKDTIYPLINGYFDFSAPSSVIKPFNNQEEGFYIIGCEVSFLFDATLISK